MTAPQITDPVERVVPVTVVNMDGCTAAHVVILAFNPAHPFEVQMAVTKDNIWSLSRDVLADGIHQLTGMGDLQVWPDEDQVCIWLAVDGMAATLRMTKELMIRFLAATERRVKLGAEQVDVDEWLDERCGFIACGRSLQQHDFLDGHEWRPAATS